MNTFTFDGKTFEFPIRVYVYFGRIGLIFTVFFPLISLFFAIAGLIGKNTFGAIFGIVMFILFAVMAFLYQKPKLILYPDKIAFVEHELIKPRYLSYEASKLYAHEVKDYKTGKLIYTLAFIYQDEKGDWQQFAKVNATYIRLDEHYFDTETTVAFFEHLLKEKNP
ncbi:Uncharacterised protein [Moraxella caprae]|uniref:Uncharacterized protein n=1 Tax=Moraxella caprae TaxID=90240 RepID=A0A378QZ39_9GAMM|nr:hypothetical protein [Moraxella caprae]STZ08185.1 Uncharacterised protein [Moraxella caprae]